MWKDPYMHLAPPSSSCGLYWPLLAGHLWPRGHLFDILLFDNIVIVTIFSSTYPHLQLIPTVLSLTSQKSGGNGRQYLSILHLATSNNIQKLNHLYIRCKYSMCLLLHFWHPRLFNIFRVIFAIYNVILWIEIDLMEENIYFMLFNQHLLIK